MIRDALYALWQGVLSLLLGEPDYSPPHDPLASPPGGTWGLDERRDDEG